MLRLNLVNANQFVILDSSELLNPSKFRCEGSLGLIFEHRLPIFSFHCFEAKAEWFNQFLSETSPLDSVAFCKGHLSEKKVKNLHKTALTKIKQAGADVQAVYVGLCPCNCSSYCSSNANFLPRTCLSNVAFEIVFLNSTTSSSPKVSAAAEKENTATERKSTETEKKLPFLSSGTHVPIQETSKISQETSTPTQETDQTTTTSLPVHGQGVSFKSTTHTPRSKTTFLNFPDPYTSTTLQTVRTTDSQRDSSTSTKYQTKFTHNYAEIIATTMSRNLDTSFVMLNTSDAETIKIPFASSEVSIKTRTSPLSKLTILSTTENDKSADNEFLSPAGSGAALNVSRTTISQRSSNIFSQGDVTTVETSAKTTEEKDQATDSGLKTSQSTVGVSEISSTITSQQSSDCLSQEVTTTVSKPAKTTEEKDQATDSGLKTSQSAVGASEISSIITSQQSSDIRGQQDTTTVGKPTRTTREEDQTVDYGSTVLQSSVGAIKTSGTSTSHSNIHGQEDTTTVEKLAKITKELTETADYGFTTLQSSADAYIKVSGTSTPQRSSITYNQEDLTTVEELPRSTEETSYTFKSITFDALSDSFATIASSAGDEEGSVHGFERTLESTRVRQKSIETTMSEESISTSMFNYSSSESTIFSNVSMAMTRAGESETSTASLVSVSGISDHESSDHQLTSGSSHRTSTTKILLKQTTVLHEDSSAQANQEPEISMSLEKESSTGGHISRSASETQEVSYSSTKRTEGKYSKNEFLLYTDIDTGTSSGISEEYNNTSKYKSTPKKKGSSESIGPPELSETRSNIKVVTSTTAYESFSTASGSAGSSETVKPSEKQSGIRTTIGTNKYQDTFPANNSTGSTGAAKLNETRSNTEAAVSITKNQRTHTTNNNDGRVEADQDTESSRFTSPAVFTSSRKKFLTDVSSEIINTVKADFETTSDKLEIPDIPYNASSTTLSKQFPSKPTTREVALFSSSTWSSSKAKSDLPPTSTPLVLLNWTSALVRERHSTKFFESSSASQPNATLFGNKIETLASKLTSAATNAKSGNTTPAYHTFNELSTLSLANADNLEIGESTELFKTNKKPSFDIVYRTTLATETSTVMKRDQNIAIAFFRHLIHRHIERFCVERHTTEEALLTLSSNSPDDFFLKIYNHNFCKICFYEIKLGRSPARTARNIFAVLGKRIDDEYTALKNCQSDDDSDLADERDFGDPEVVKLIRTRSPSTILFFVNEHDSEMIKKNRTVRIVSIEGSTNFALAVNRTAGLSETIEDVNALCRKTKYCNEMQCNLDDFVFYGISTKLILPSNYKKLDIGQSLNVSCAEQNSSKVIEVTCGERGTLQPYPPSIICSVDDSDGKELKDAEVPMNNEIRKSCDECNQIGTDRCEEVEGGFMCFCKPNWSGAVCWISPNQCEIQQLQCGHNGTCFSEVDRAYCWCDEGYAGVHCEVSKANLSLLGPAEGSVDAAVTGSAVALSTTEILLMVGKGLLLLYCPKEGQDTQVFYQNLRSLVISVAGLVVLLFHHPGLLDISPFYCSLWFCMVTILYSLGIGFFALEARNVYEVAQVKKRNSWDDFLGRTAFGAPKIAVGNY
ncbi:hypothetical protein RB195_002377 [Necator americanus]|uniref:EGF-like domain-containing protein n=1 Tax=Necator americanus TaxID=51031 RepID=A0ABR1DKA5_NECAM